MLKTALEEIYHCLWLAEDSRIKNYILLSSSETCTIYSLRRKSCWEQFHCIECMESH